MKEVEVGATPQDILDRLADLVRDAKVVCIDQHCLSEHDRALVFKALCRAAAYERRQGRRMGRPT